MLRVAANEELESVEDVRDAILAEAQMLADEDVALNKRMAYNGAELISDGDDADRGLALPMVGLEHQT
jgi:methylthioribose-1-phosphate isomerase